MLRIPKDVVRPDAPPDVRFPCANPLAEVERGPEVSSECQLENAGMSLHALHPEARPRFASGNEVGNQLSNGTPECCLRCVAQPPMVPPGVGERFVGRHAGQPAAEASAGGSAQSCMSAASNSSNELYTVPRGARGAKRA